MALANTKSTVPRSFMKALDQIKAKGFSHIKVELEGRLGRGGSSERCSSCSGRGWLRCTTCNHAGYIIEKDTPIECSDCSGDGSSECRRCNGRGFTQGGWTDSWCRDFIVKALKSPTARSLVYGEFYWDGSVDSEYTFTVAIDKAGVVPEIIEAFNKLGEKIGNGVGTQNAGLHIAVLPEGAYPCKRGLLNSTFMRNFRTEVAKLLPALYFLGTHTGTTRDLDFRKPFVSASEKYSAIFTHGDTAIEYRIFDPCFDKPEAFYDKVEIIAQTLKYYSSATTKVSYKKFEMYNLPELSRLYSSLGNYDALLKTVSSVKPAKSLRVLKEERGIKINKTIIKQLTRQKSQEDSKAAKKQYEDAVDNYSRMLRNAAQWLLTDYFARPPRERDIRVTCPLAGTGFSDAQLVGSEELRMQFVAAHPELFGYTAPRPLERGVNVGFRNFVPSAAYTLTASRPLDEESNEYNEE